MLSDQHWFTIKQTIDFNTSDNNNLVNEVVGDTIRIRNVEEVNQTILNNEVESTCIRVRNVEEVNQTYITPVKRKLPDWMKSPSPNTNKKKKDDSGSSSQAIISPSQSTRVSSPVYDTIQSNDNELSNEATVTPEAEISVDPPNSPNPIAIEPEIVKIKTEIKEEPKATGNDCVASASTNSPQKVIIKKDPDPIPVNLRSSCSFGIRCYRFVFYILENLMKIF